MALNIEGAIRGDDPRIPKVDFLNGVTVLGFLNGKVVSIDATLMDCIDIATNHLPYIGEDYYVYVWNKESQVYVKTEIYVKGEQGEKGDPGVAGDIGASVELQVTETHVQWRVVGATTWDNLIALSQLEGEKGDTGDTGAKGDKGDTGAKGDKGDAGKSAYQVWIDEGNTGTISAYLDSLKGEKGNKGEKGDTGESNTLSIGTVTGGIDASASITGTAPSQTLNLVLPKGEKGEQGLKGDTGEKGDTGIGVPIGGTTGQQLMKKSNVDYDFEWQTPAGAGDMLKSEYDKNGNGIVDNAEKVNGFTVETNIPANAKFTDTVYTHPTSHPYSMITGAPTSLPANGGDSATVNGKTVEENVPADAKFTDTTYEEITEAEINTGTASTLRTITARRITYILNKAQVLINSAISALTKSSVGLDNVDNVKQASKTEFDTHDSDTTRHITSSERTAWNAKGSSNLALGETSATAYRGDRGKIAYDHSQVAHAPSNAQKNSDITKAEIEEKLTGIITTHSHTVTKDNVGLGSVDNTSDINKPVSTAQQTALNAKMDSSKFQVVESLPVSPVSGVFYFVKE